MTKRLENRVAIVTGAAQNIGRNLAYRLAAEGAALVLADKLAEVVDQTAKEITKETGAVTAAFAGDLSKEEAAAALFSLSVERFGRVDILVNNAGGGVILPFLEHTPDTLRETLDRNLWTTIWCIRAVLPHMVERRYGRIINIGAESVRNGLWMHAGYNAAKGGVHGLTTGLAREFATSGITVNTVAPSGVETKSERQSRLREKNPDFFNAVLGTIPLGRLARMEEVSATVAFLASDEAAFITGQVISVNGGSSML